MEAPKIRPVHRFDYNRNKAHPVSHNYGRENPLALNVASWQLTCFDIRQSKRHWSAFWGQRTTVDTKQKARAMPDRAFSLDTLLTEGCGQQFC
jgi:hypothetical protein